MLGLEAAPRALSLARGGYYTATHNVPKGGGGCPSTSSSNLCVRQGDLWQECVFPVVVYKHGVCGDTLGREARPPCTSMRAQRRNTRPRTHRMHPPVYMACAARVLLARHVVSAAGGCNIAILSPAGSQDFSMISMFFSNIVLRIRAGFSGSQAMDVCCLKTSLGC